MTGARWGLKLTKCNAIEPRTLGIERETCLRMIGFNQDRRSYVNANTDRAKIATELCHGFHRHPGLTLEFQCLVLKNSKR